MVWAAALLAAQLTHGRLPSPFTARDVYRNEWTGLTEPRVVQGALEGLAELGWLRAEAVRIPDGGRPSVRFHINPRVAAGAAGPAEQVGAQRSTGNQRAPAGGRPTVRVPDQLAAPGGQA
jgi:hypothetical protein